MTVFSVSFPCQAREQAGCRPDSPQGGAPSVSFTVEEGNPDGPGHPSSILNFIEYAFGLTQGGIGNSAYPYADALVMDTDANHPYSLSDFFTFTQTNFHAFQTIGPLEYPETCFHNPTQTGCFNNYPVDPDNDANDTED